MRLHAETSGKNAIVGPVLGLLRADSLDHAIELQNTPAFGPTGGLHSLDPAEVRHWLERVKVGNAYVNRGTTGAIVRRQPLGGWKRSTVGATAKAGGPNYVLTLGRWTGRLDGIDVDCFDKVRVLGAAPEALLAAPVDDNPVVGHDRIELLRWVQEQSVTETRHRYGNVVPPT